MDSTATLAGGGDCTFEGAEYPGSPPFSDCSAGFGVMDAWVSGTGGDYDGFRQGSFGILGISNRNPPAPGLYLDADVFISYCFTYSSSCDIADDFSVPLQVPEPSGDPIDSLSFNFFTNTTFPPIFPLCSLACDPEADLAFGQFTLNLNGVADESFEDPVFLALPARCGSAEGGVRFTSHDPTTPKSVGFPEALLVAGCPEAAFTHDVHGYRVTFDGSSSSTLTDGRELAKFKWNFGDGKSKTTTEPTVDHTYERSDDYQVRLTVIDSEGAISSLVTHTVHDSKTTLGVDKTRQVLKGRGEVKPPHPSGEVKLALLVKKSGTFEKIDNTKAQLNSNSRYAAAFDRPNADVCRINALFTGHSDHLASAVSKTFDC
jgi:hypothetical protein